MFFYFNMFSNHAPTVVRHFKSSLYKAYICTVCVVECSKVSVCAEQKVKSRLSLQIETSADVI